MWFKNIRLFKFQTPLKYNPEELTAQLANAAFKPCPKSHSHSYGFVQPVGEEEEALVFGQNGCMLIRLRIEEKVLPSSVVRENLQAKLKELEQQTGRKVYKDEKERLKDEVYQTLLTRAFTKSSYINGYIDTHNNWLILDCAGGKKMAHFISMLMRATNNVIFAPEYTPIPQVLTDWLTLRRYPSDLSIGNACLIKDPDEKGSIIRIKNEDLFNDKVQAFLNDGSSITQMNLVWRENVRFTLKEDFALTSVKFLDAVKELAYDGLSETKEERLASDFMIMTQTIVQLMETLEPCFAPIKEESTEKEAATI